MAKKFYTEKDIEDLFNSGVKSLRVTDNVQLTELAYEKARSLGFQLLADSPDMPPSAPVRPYLSGQTVPSAPKMAAVSKSSSQPKTDSPKPSALDGRIRAAVFAKMGNQVDSKLLDTIIHRVLKSTGLK